MGLDLELLDGLHNRVQGQVAEEGGLVVDAVQHVHTAAIDLTVDRRNTRLPGADGSHAGRQSHQVLDISAGRKINHLLPRQYAPQLGGGALQLHSGGLHSNGILHLAYAQGKVEDRPLVYNQVESLEPVRAEPRFTGFQSVVSWKDVQDDVDALVVRDGPGFHAGRRVPQQNGGLRHTASRSI